MLGGLVLTLSLFLLLYTVPIVLHDEWGSGECGRRRYVF